MNATVSATKRLKKVQSSLKWEELDWFFYNYPNKPNARSKSGITYDLLTKKQVKHILALHEAFLEVCHLRGIVLIGSFYDGKVVRDEVDGDFPT